MNLVSGIELVTTFSVERNGNSCPWLPLSQPSAYNNTVYFSVQHKDVSYNI